MINLFSILDQKQKKNFIIQIIMMFFGMFLEIFSVGILFPIINVMQKGSINQIKEIINKYSIISISFNDQSLLLILMVFLAVVYIVKMIFLSFFSYKQTKFIYNIKSNISNKLYSKYLTQPYIFHLKNNSAQLINNTIFLVEKLAQGLTSFMIILTEASTLFGLVVFLILLEPTGTISVILSLGILSSLFYYVSKRKISHWGTLTQLYEGLRLQHLQQGLGGIKDVKILGREKHFLNLYKNNNNNTALYYQKLLFLSSLPKFWLEMLAVTGLAILVIVMDRLNTPFNKIIPIIGIFAAAAFRLIPSINRLITASQTVGFTKSSILKLKEEFDNLVEPEITTFEYPYKNRKFNKISLENISFTYPDSEKTALNTINLQIEYGASIGFIGTSGAGKSTLIDILLGLLKPQNGKILVDNFDIDQDISGWQSQVGYVPQSIFLTDDTFRNNIAFGVEENDIDEFKILDALKKSQLIELIESLPLGLDTLVGERGVRLSGGQRQRIGIARALYNNPNILIFDEATSALDNTTESNIMESIKMLKGEKTILIIAHRLNTISDCDFICRIENGILIDKKENK